MNQDIAHEQELQDERQLWIAFSVAKDRGYAFDFNQFTIDFCMLIADSCLKERRDKNDG